MRLDGRYLNLSPASAAFVFGLSFAGKHQPLRVFAHFQTFQDTYALAWEVCHRVSIASRAFLFVVWEEAFLEAVQLSSLLSFQSLFCSIQLPFLCEGLNSLPI